jgi:hypothetical protein
VKGGAAGTSWPPKSMTRSVMHGRSVRRIYLPSEEKRWAGYNEAWQSFHPSFRFESFEPPPWQKEGIRGLRSRRSSHYRPRRRATISSSRYSTPAVMLRFRSG